MKFPHLTQIHRTIIVCCADAEKAALVITEDFMFWWRLHFCKFSAEFPFHQWVWCTNISKSCSTAFKKIYVNLDCETTFLTMVWWEHPDMGARSIKLGDMSGLRGHNWPGRAPNKLGRTHAEPDDGPYQNLAHAHARSGRTSIWLGRAHNGFQGISHTCEGA